MFHTRVVTANGVVVDFDCVSYVMDRELLGASLWAMRRARETGPDPFDLAIMERMGSRYDPDVHYGAQWVWDYYCERHLEKHGEPFGPNVLQPRDRDEQPAKASPDLGEKPEGFIRVLTGDRIPPSLAKYVRRQASVRRGRSRKRRKQQEPVRTLPVVAAIPKLWHLYAYPTEEQKRIAGARPPRQDRAQLRIVHPRPSESSA